MSYCKAKYKYVILFLLITLLFLTIQMVSYRMKLNNNGSELVDTDTYMRLVRVEQLAQTGNWYDNVIHRSNYPYGETLHWTRPLDVILLAGAYLLTPFQGFEQALLTWGIIISPILGVFWLFALFWATRPVLNNSSRLMLWLLFMSQTVLLQVFFFGRPDHHSLLLLLFIIILGCLFRIDDNFSPKYMTLGGFVSALAMWVSVESIFTIIMVFMTLGVCWIIRGDKYASILSKYSLSLFFFSAIFVFVERPLVSILLVEYDKISIAHLFVFMLAAAASHVLTLSKNAVPSSKLIQLFLLLFVSGIVIYLVFPAFYQGPMAGVNKDIVPIWLDNVREVQPVWSLDVYHKIIIIGSIGLSCIYLLVYGMKRLVSERPDLFYTLLCGFIVFLPLGIYQIRMDYYLLTIAIIVLSQCLDDIISMISNSRLSIMWKPPLRIAVSVLFILCLPAIGVIATPSEPSENKRVDVDLKGLSSFLQDYQMANSDAQTVLAFIDFGPELLYRTNYNVIATPYHRNDSGILFTYDVMASDNSDVAYGLLKERTVDMIIICPESSERKFYKKANDEPTLYERLVRGEQITFLEEMQLPAELADQFKVFRFIS